MVLEKVLTPYQYSETPQGRFCKLVISTTLQRSDSTDPDRQYLCNVLYQQVGGCMLISSLSLCQETRDNSQGPSPTRKNSDLVDYCTEYTANHDWSLKDSILYPIFHRLGSPVILVCYQQEHTPFLVLQSRYQPRIPPRCFPYPSVSRSSHTFFSTPNIKGHMNDQAGCGHSDT